MEGVAVQLCTWDVQGGCGVSFRVCVVQREWCTQSILQHWRRQCSVHTHTAHGASPVRVASWPADKVPAHMTH